MTTRFKAFICNMIVICLSVLSIASYFFMPFWKVEVNAVLNAESIQALLPKQEGGSENESEEGNFSIENIASYIGDEEIPITLSFSLETSYILSSYQGDAKASVRKMIDDNINNLVDQLYTPLNKIMKIAMTGVSKNLLKEQSKALLKGVYGDEKSDSELEQILADANVNVDEKVDTVIDALYAENATVDGVSTTIVNTIDEVCAELRTHNPEEFEDLMLSEDQKNELKTGMEEMLSAFAQEDGTIDMNDMLADLLLGFLENGGNAPEPRNTAVKAMAFLENEPVEPEKDSKEELKEELRAFITEMIPEETAETIVLALQYIGYLILFTFFTWAYLILKILIKLAMPVNAIKLGLPIWWGWLPYFILVFMPSLAISLIQNPTALSFLGEEVVIGLTKSTEIINALSLNVSFTSCAVISFFIAIALAVFSIAYYGGLRRRLKKIKKGIIVENVEKKTVKTETVPEPEIEAVETTEETPSEE